MIKDKIFDYKDIKKKIDKLKRQNKKIVFTNGCFDIIHSGHALMLQECKKYGDILIVAINSDYSVKLNKGDSRPIIPILERMTLISAFEFVDYVFCFNEENPLRYIEELKPDVYIKGGDYNINNIVGKGIGYNEIKDYCKSIKLISLKNNISTTDIIDKILKVYGSDNNDRRSKKNC
jgi:D-beta-D-heptose 7-phosphate kinase/D-beta-D-heptose 1-phosphate adenosyltransferase